MRENGLHRVRCLLTLGAVVGIVSTAQAARLTYRGASGGSWWAENAWQTETGSVCSWTDGNTAVIGDVAVVLPSDATVEGLEWSATAKRTLTGDGKLTVGAGGILNGGSSEINIQNAGGLHLSASQTWNTTSASKRMLCFDGSRTITAASGITITVAGTTEVRWNAVGNFTSAETIVFTGNSYFSPSKSRGLGRPTLVFDGYRNGESWISSYGEGNDSKDWNNMAFKLILRNGACIKLWKDSAVDIPEIVVDGTSGQTSLIDLQGTSGSLALTAARTEFDIAEGCDLRLAAAFAESGVSAKIVKKGLGTLEIAANASYSGGFEVSEGLMALTSPTAGGTGSFSVSDGATLRLAQNGVLRSATLPGGTIELANGSFVLTADAEMTQQESAAHFTGTGTLAAADGVTLKIAAWTMPSGVVYDGEAGGRVEIGTVSGSGWTKSGPGTMAVAAFDGYSGGVTVAGGVLELASQAVFPGTVTTSGTGALHLLAGGGLDFSKIVGTGRVSVGGTIEMDPLTVSGGNFSVLPDAQVLAKSVVISGGTLTITDGAPYAGVERLTVSGGTIAFAATATLACPVELTGSATVTAGGPQAGAEPVVGTFGGFVNAANATSKAKLSVMGTNDGVVRMAGGGAFTKSNTELFVAGAGILEIVSNEVTIASYAGLEYDGRKLLVKDGGTLRQTGGNLFVGSGAGSKESVLEVAEGGLLVSEAAGGLFVGVNQGFGRLVVSGGEVRLSGTGAFRCGYSTVSSEPFGTGEVVLTGGVLKTGRMLGNFSSLKLILDGGTLEFLQSTVPWFSGDKTTVVSVGAKGGLLQTDGHDVGFRPCTVEGRGRLTVCCGGTVSFAGVSTDWTGGVRAEDSDLAAAGDLAFGSGPVELIGGCLALANGAVLANVVTTEDGGSVSVAEGETASVGAAGTQFVKDGAGALKVGAFALDAVVTLKGGSIDVAAMDEPAPLVAGEPAFWVDASSCDTYEADDQGNVSVWHDRRSGENYPLAAKHYNPPLVSAAKLNGRNVLDFGKLSAENRMLEFDRYIDGIRTVFWVVGSRNGGGFLLGDSRESNSARCFHRGGNMGAAASDALWKKQAEAKNQAAAGTTWLNGTVVDGTATGLSGTFDLVAWRLSESDEQSGRPAGASWFATCYAPSDGRLTGGQELGEVIIYTNRLSDAEVTATQAYLARKWFPESALARVVSLGELHISGSGVAFGVSLANATVTANRVVVDATGAMDAGTVLGLAYGQLVFADGATLSVAFDDQGMVAPIAVPGDVTFGTELKYAVTRPSGASRAGGTVLTASGTISGNPSWQKAGKNSCGVEVSADRHSLAFTPLGMMLIFR